MKKIHLLIMLIFLVLLSACENANNNTTTTSVEESTSTEKSTENKEYISVKDKLKEIKSFLKSDIWHEFVNISWFAYDGKSSTGGTMDLDFTINELGKSMETKKEYDTYINELDNEKYSDIKSIWEKLSPEIDKLYNKIKENPPVAKDQSYVLDTGLYEQYSEAFEKAINKIEE